MSKLARVIRIFLASPGDVKDERAAFPNVISRLSKNLIIKNLGENHTVIEPVTWEKDSWPGFGDEAQDVINRQIGDYDIFVGVMWSRVGSPTKKYPGGTIEEFFKAYQAWKDTGRPEILFYFNQAPLVPNQINIRELEQVQAFQEKIAELGGLYGTYSNSTEFETQLFDGLSNTIFGLKSSANINVPILAAVPPFDRSHPFTDVKANDFEKLKVANHPLAYSSFQPTRDQRFLRIFYPTTMGIVNDEQVENKIFTIEDPVRPYTIQIGETRSQRKKSSPRAIPDLMNLPLQEVQSMYPFIQTVKFKWLRMVLAELAIDPEVIEFLAKDEDSQVRRVAANNPSAPQKLQKYECLFCKPKFREKRIVQNASTPKTVIIRNDFPFGPYFHYIALTSEPVHSWEDIDEKQLDDMNLAIWKFLQAEYAANTLQAPGIHVGLNSTIRHLVIGRRTRASAGASIAHVHKQFWGMSPASFNLGDYLASVIRTYQNANIDYLHEYLESLRAAGFVIWEDINVAIYVPIGQISLNELRIIIKRETHSFIDLNEAEIHSFSKAEYFVTQIYKEIGITSFNELLITEKIGRATPGFRLIFTFITREVDLAVSELNNLFVVDNYPNDTVELIRRSWLAPS